MIERINNVAMILKPNLSNDGKAKSVTVKAEGKQSEPAEYLYNPNLADKISISRQSIAEEKSLLNQANMKIRQLRSKEKSEERAGAPATSLESLKRSITRIKSLLYLVASVSGADSDALEALQQKLADELSGYDKVFKKVKLHNIETPDIKTEEMDISREIKAEDIDPQTAVQAKEKVTEIEEIIERELDSISSDEPEEQSRTEAVLDTTDQNLAAAESAFYPEEIVNRATEVAHKIREKMIEAYDAQSHLEPDEVYKLLGAG